MFRSAAAKWDQTSDASPLIHRTRERFFALCQSWGTSQRRLFLAEDTLALCGGNARQAERRFGWGRETITKGLHELQSGVRCVENFAARGRARWEDRDRQLVQDIRELVEPHTQTDPELKSSRRYTNWSAREVLKALRTQKGYKVKYLPSERTMRDILNSTARH